MGSGHVLNQSQVCRTAAICFGLSLALFAVGGWEEDAREDGVTPQADDWITINKDYSSQRYVDLDQITPRNVDKLKEVCEIQLNEPVYFNSGILKVGRTLYTTTLRGTYAFDAVTCELNWRHTIDFKEALAGLSNRGAAYLDGKIFRGAADGHVIALDAKTGDPVPAWPNGGVKAADPARLEVIHFCPDCLAREGFYRHRRQRQRRCRTSDGF